ncbi:DUF222 domain-containing protein [Agrococcus sp. DT81.2]|uniref:HNH endonuclease signature motif containing protein n=1 Tax=Agrococcus sp. DT81.2 TaxID=3393414 RepID=UPI003CE5203E
MTRSEQAAAAVQAARDLLDDAGSFPLESHADFVDLLGAVAALSRVVDSLKVRIAAGVEERSHGWADESLCLRMGHRSPREALASAFGIRDRQASELLTMAATTSATPGLTGHEVPARYQRVAGALAGGELSLAQAHAIVATLEPAAPRADREQLAWAEDALVGAATDPAAPLVPELLVTQARAYAAALDPDGVLPSAERQRSMRSLRLWQRRDGMWRLEMDSPPEDGSALKSLLDAYTGPRVKVGFRDDDDGTAGASADEPPIDDRKPEQKRHDVLVTLVRAHAASGDAPVAGGEAPVLVLTGTVEAYTAYLQGVAHPERTLTIEHTGDLIPIETIERLVCDAKLQHVVVNSCFHTLALGRTERLFNRAIRRALAARDKGCRVPGCGMPVAWCEAHHIVPWQLGGPTDVDNGILVCSYHHHEIHAGRLRVEKAGPEPGNWRIVAELRPADPYARSRRKPAERSPSTPVQPVQYPTRDLDAASTGAGSSSGVLAMSAAPALARRLPDVAPATRPPRPPRRTRHARPRLVEQRLRGIIRRRRPAARVAAFDLRPPGHIVMRT